MTFQRSQRYTKPALSTGVLNVFGNSEDLVTTSDNVTIDVLGGQGIIVERNSLGINILREVTWEAQNVSLPFTTATASVNIDRDGNVVFGVGLAIPLPQDRKDNIFISALNVISGIIVTISSGAEPTYDYSGSLIDSLLTLGPINSAIDPFNAIPNGVDISGNMRQFELTPGSESLPLIGTLLNSRTPHILTRTAEIDPLPMFLVRQSNASFSLSPTAEVDPDTFEASGLITKFTVSGLETRITSNAHGLSNGDSVTISDTTNYNGIFIISNISTNNFDIPTTFVGDDATGSWVALTAIPAGLFTVQRAVIFPVTGVMALYFGTVTYLTSADALAQFQSLEVFIELGPSVEGIRIFDMIIQQGETDIANAVFVPGTRFRI